MRIAYALLEDDDEEFDGVKTILAYCTYCGKETIQVLHSKRRLFVCKNCDVFSGKSFNGKSIVFYDRRIT